MKKIGDIVNEVLVKGFTYREPFVDPNIMKETADIVNRLFIKLIGILPGFRLNCPTQTEVDAAKVVWIEEFIKANIHTKEQIDNGLQKCIDNEENYLPPVGKFIRYCNEGGGMPSTDDAWDDVKHQISNSHKQFSHPVTEAAYMLTGSWDLKQKSEKEAKAIFLKHFLSAKLRFMNNEPIEKLPAHSRIENRESEHLPPMPASISEFIGNLDRIQEEKTGKPIEPINYDDVVVDSSRFHELTSYEKAMPVIKKILGMK